MGQQYFPIYTTTSITRFVEDVMRKDEDENEGTKKIYIKKHSHRESYIFYT